MRSWSAGPATAWARSSTGWRSFQGYLIAYLNIDEVIRIIREEDDPKAEMVRRWELTEVPG